ncbi:ClpXP protease specificity-enhancing factor [Pasteurella sp. PK-2025]|uniref:ClpXP protease specificity-enhancing factor n=1 Tax=unclassified Pasteurella TaxID=2621516 RepID=UPI003C748EAA
MEYRASPKRPYLLRAYYDWLIDNDFTPYLVVDATYFGVKVPVEYVKDGQIVLNLSANATGNLILGNDSIQFSARFRGVSQDIYIPMGAALAIYARENGDGVMFEPESIYDELDQPVSVEQPLSFVEAVDKPRAGEHAEKATKTDTKPEKKGEKKGVSHLRIIK